MADPDRWDGLCSCHTHDGVHIVIKVGGQIVVDATSDQLHSVAKLAGDGTVCEILSGNGAFPVRQPVGLVEVFVTPVQLPNEYPDPQW